MSAWRERVEIAGGRAVLYLGDNREVWPALGVRPDAIVSDPPYGMGWDNRVTGGAGGHSPNSISRTYGITICGDDTPFDPAPWLSASEHVVLWGANHYSARLPLGRTLVWIKRLDGGFGSFLSDAEIAWAKGGHGVYCFRDTSMMAETRDRAHPTQKPLPLMSWCLDQAKVAPGALVADPYMGAGSTGIACMRRGCRFIGIEIDEGYFRAACRRIAEAARQPDLLIPETAA